jgi:hypothetical protein
MRNTQVWGRMRGRPFECGYGKASITTVHFRTIHFVTSPAIGIVRRESLGNRLVGGREDMGGAVDRVGERAAQEKLAVVGGRAG